MMEAEQRSTGGEVEVDKTHAAAGGDESISWEGDRAPAWAATMVVLSILLVALSTLGLLMIGQTQRHTWLDADREAAVAVARDVSMSFITISGSNAPQHIDKMLAQSTGPFRKQLTALSGVFQNLLKQGQVESSGTVTATGVERMDNETAVVLVSAKTTVKNTQIVDGAARDYRLVVSLHRSGDQWLASAVEVA